LPNPQVTSVEPREYFSAGFRLANISLYSSTKQIVAIYASASGCPKISALSRVATPMRFWSGICLCSFNLSHFFL